MDRFTMSSDKQIGDSSLFQVGVVNRSVKTSIGIVFFEILLMTTPVSSKTTRLLPLVDALTFKLLSLSLPFVRSMHGCRH